MEKFLLKSLGIQVVNILIELEANNKLLSCPSLKTAKERKEFLSKLGDPKLGKSISQLEKSCADTFSSFFSQMQSLADHFELPLKPLDSKLKKQLFQMHQQTFLSQLMEETNPPTVFHLVVTLLYLKTFRQVLFSPQKCVPSILASLKPKLNVNVFEKLTECKEKVSAFIIEKSEEKRKLLIPELTEEMKQLKEIVLNPSSSKESKEVEQESRKKK